MQTWREYSSYCQNSAHYTGFKATDSHGSCILTTLSYLTDVHALLCSHEAQHRKHHKACEETGSTVDDSQQKRIPIDRAKEREREKVGGQNRTL